MAPVPALCAAAAALAAAGAAAALLQAPAGGAEARVAFFPNAGHAIPIAGTEAGLFDGVPAEVRVFDSGPQAVESLFSGAVDMAYLGPGPAVGAFLGSDGGVVVLSGAASGGSSLVARPGAGISSAADLAGRVVAAPQVANTQDVSLRTYVAAAGLRTAERGGNVTVLNTASPEAYSLFGRGMVDAAWVPEPWATMMVRDLGGERLFREEELWPGGEFASVLLVADAGFVRDRPGLAAAWLEGHEAAAGWIAADPEAAREAFEAFMLREYRTGFSEGVAAEALANVRVTTDPLPGTVEEFARRADALGYLGRGGYDLGGMFGGA